MFKWKKIYKLQISIISLCFGCILTNSIIKYKYEDPIYNPTPSRNITVILNKVDDHPDAFKDGIFIEGIKKNGYGMEGGYIFTKPRGNEIIKNMFITELQNVGITISNDAKANVPEIEIQVNQIFIEPEVGFFAADVIAVIDINTFIHFKNKTYKRRFKAFGETTTIIWPDYFYYLALDRSLKNLARKTLPEVVAIIQNEKGSF
ncbi:hypothetical protein EHQ24_07960 [Leptospira noumeaensis]|uniref:Lipoprotein n=1 Tax=Leptospira noumeaensis TaxID=2484964 RepID=A0A4R9I9P6_9LEPT|nr:hypothetical protein [Leptospira noumeaensis]TGK83229.1 hypothetical protein EHQ24_07960 [Leptospira noumeaensis]